MKLSESERKRREGKEGKKKGKGETRRHTKKWSPGQHSHSTPYTHNTDDETHTSWKNKIIETAGLVSLTIEIILRSSRL